MELIALAAEWARTRAGEGRLVLVAGEAGMGKTTVVRAFAESVGDDATVITGQTFGQETMPYTAIAQAVRRLAAIHGTERIRSWAGAGAGALATIVPALGESPASGGTGRLQLYEAVADVLEGAARVRPLVLVVEDLHWAGAPTADLLRFLDGALADARILIVVTYRSDEILGRHPLRPLVAELRRRTNTTALDLPALDAADITSLVRPLLPAGASLATVRRIIERSEGIPYFAEELARSTGGRGVLPLTLREALLARTQALTVPTQRLLRIASTVGVAFHHSMLEAISELCEADLDDCLHEAVDAAILTADEDGYTFRHALLREVVHDELLPGEHARLHSRIADLLLARPELYEDAPTAAAFHLLAARRWQEGFVACLHRARDLDDAHPDCIRLYEAALEVWDRVEAPESVIGPRSEVLERASLAAGWLGDQARARQLIEASLRETPPGADPLDRARRLILLARPRVYGTAGTRLEAVDEALALTPTDRPTAERAQAYELLAQLAMLHGDLAGGVRLADLGLAVARDGGYRDTELQLMLTQGSCLAGLGREADGLAVMEEAGASSEPRGRLRYYINLSHHLNLACRYREAADLAVEGIESARDLGLERYFGAMLAGNAAEPLLALGECDAAEELIDRALALDPPDRHVMQLQLLRLHLAVLRDDPTADELQEAVESLTELDAEPQFLTSLAAVAALHRLADGDPAGAWPYVRGLLAGEVRDHPTAWWRMAVVGRAALADLRRRAPDAAEWAEEIDRLDEWVRRIPDHPVAPLWRAMYAAEAAGTSASWQEALGVLPDCRPIWLTLQAYARLTRALLREARVDDARTVVATAVDLADRTGAPRLGDRFRALLPDRPGPTPTAPRRPTPVGRAVPDPADDGPGATARLTSREREVLVLVAEGLSNGEIGRRLFVTTKTASVHVSHILAKLGVRSRGEAAAWAYQQGFTSRSDPARRAPRRSAG